MYAVAPKGTARPACAHCTSLVTTWVVACRPFAYLVPSPSSRLNVTYFLGYEIFFMPYLVFLLSDYGKFITATGGADC